MEVGRHREQHTSCVRGSGCKQFIYHNHTHGKLQHHGIILQISVRAGILFLLQKYTQTNEFNYFYDCPSAQQPNTYKRLLQYVLPLSLLITKLLLSDQFICWLYATVCTYLHLIALWQCIFHAPGIFFQPFEPFFGGCCFA
jgi:hypothetical protein